MEIQCPICGGRCETDFEPEVGQHIICPFCNKKFSYGIRQESVSRTIMAVCPYCGFAEPVDAQYSGQIGECSHCHGEFTIVPNARGIPFQPQTVAARQCSGNSNNSSDGVLGFLLGLILGILGVLLAVLIDKKKYLKSSLYGLLAQLALSILLSILLIGGIVGCTGMSRSVARRAAGAASALSSSEGARSQAEVDMIGSDTIRNLGD